LLKENQQNADPLPQASYSMMESHFIIPADLSNTLSKNQSELWLLDSNLIFLQASIKNFKLFFSQKGNWMYCNIANSLMKALGQHDVNECSLLYVVNPQSCVSKRCCSRTEINTPQFKQHMKESYNNTHLLVKHSIWWTFLTYLQRLKVITRLCALPIETA
jgi:hypothetical protein